MQSGLDLQPSSFSNDGHKTSPAASSQNLGQLCDAELMSQNTPLLSVAARRQTGSVVHLSHESSCVGQRISLG